MDFKVNLDGVLDLSDKGLNDLSILNSIEDPYKCKVLKLNDNHLTKIENISTFTNLEELNLGQNKISKIENLNNLEKLKKLLLYTNEIRIIEGVNELKNLQELNLGYNKIGKIQGLETLRNLKVLILDNNNIVKITNCESLISIHTIVLDENPIQEIKSIGNLPNLTRLRIHNNRLPLAILNALEMKRSTPVVPDIEKVKVIARNEFVQIRDKIFFAYKYDHEKLRLSLNYCEIESIRSIENLSKIKRLKKLDLWGNRINKIEGLGELKDLESLSLGKNEITKIEGLDSLQKLKSLTLEENKILELKNLSNLVNLKYLGLRKNYIRTISGLNSLENLKNLDLESNDIQNLNGIESLKKLTKLNLSNNLNISDFSILSKLSSLKRLLLKKTNISDISMLNLGHLIELDLSENKISEIPKINLPELKILKLDKNQLKTMDSLCQFPNLECLKLNENKIEELKCIHRMKYTLNKFYIDNNKLSLDEDQVDKLKISDNKLYPNNNNSRRFILYVLLKKFFDSKQNQGQEEIDFDGLFDNSPVLIRLKNMNEYPYVRDIVKMFRKDYEIRVLPNNIPKSIVNPNKIAQEIEEKILNYLETGKKGYPLMEIVDVHHLGNKKAVKRLLRIIKDRELTKIPFLFTDTEIVRAPEKKKEVINENEKTIGIMSYLLECFNSPDAIKRKDGDPQIEQLAHYILGKSSTSKEKITIIDVGAGYGDLLEAINNSGIVSKICYIPIEIDKGKWEEIEDRCKSIGKLEYSSPSDCIKDIKNADIIFFVNVFHELKLNNRVDLLFDAFKLIQKGGQILIHEVIILPKLETDFLMWDKDDFKLIMSKINSNIKIESAETRTRPGGWPLHTIIISYNDVNLITKEEIRSAIISSLKEIKKKWLNYKTSQEFIKIEDEDIKRRIIAFLMAQNHNIDLWINEFLSINKEEDYSKEKKSIQKEIVNPYKINVTQVTQKQDPKFIAKLKGLRREIIEYYQLVEYQFLSEYGITYKELEDIEKLPIMVEMLNEIIIKNESLRMHGYSSDKRKKHLEELYEFFTNIV